LQGIRMGLAGKEFAQNRERTGGYQAAQAGRRKPRP
jgi:hypothetical protein